MKHRLFITLFITSVLGGMQQESEYPTMEKVREHTIYGAIMNNNAEALEKLIQEGEDPNEIMRLYNFAIPRFAAQPDKKPVCLDQLLLHKLNFQTIKDSVMYCASNGYTEFARKIIENIDDYYKEQHTHDVVTPLLLYRKLLFTYRLPRQAIQIIFAHAPASFLNSTCVASLATPAFSALVQLPHALLHKTATILEFLLRSDEKVKQHGVSLLDSEQAHNTLPLVFYALNYSTIKKILSTPNIEGKTAYEIAAQRGDQNHAALFDPTRIDENFDEMLIQGVKRKCGQFCSEQIKKRNTNQELTTQP